MIPTLLACDAWPDWSPALSLCQLPCCLRTSIGYDTPSLMSFTCPSCQKPAVEGQTACVACGFSLADTDRRLGIPPQLSAPVADMHGLLSSAEVRRIASLTQAIERKFPQVHLCVVIDHVPAEVSMSVFTFWIFNRAGISSSVERGPDNHLVLLVIDASDRASKGAACMIGYGLEPFIPKQTLEACLSAIGPELNSRRVGKAALGFFTAVENILKECCVRANQDELLKDMPTEAPSDLVPSDGGNA